MARQGRRVPVVWLLPVQLRPVYVTDQQWPPLKRTYRTGHQGRNRENAYALALQRRR